MAYIVIITSKCYTIFMVQIIFLHGTYPKIYPKDIYYLDVNYILLCVCVTNDNEEQLCITVLFCCNFYLDR